MESRNPKFKDRLKNVFLSLKNLACPDSGHPRRKLRPCCQKQEKRKLTTLDMEIGNLEEGQYLSTKQEKAFNDLFTCYGRKTASHPFRLYARVNIDGLGPTNGPEAKISGVLPVLSVTRLKLNDGKRIKQLHIKGSISKRPQGMCLPCKKCKCRTSRSFLQLSHRHSDSHQAVHWKNSAAPYKSKSIDIQNDLLSGVKLQKTGDEFRKPPPPKDQQELHENLERDVYSPTKPAENSPFATTTRGVNRFFRSPSRSPSMYDQLKELYEAEIAKSKEYSEDNRDCSRNNSNPIQKSTSRTSEKLRKLYETQVSKECLGGNLPKHRDYSLNMGSQIQKSTSRNSEKSNYAPRIESSNKQPEIRDKVISEETPLKSKQNDYNMAHVSKSTSSNTRKSIRTSRTSSNQIQKLTQNKPISLVSLQRKPPFSEQYYENSATSKASIEINEPSSDSQQEDTCAQAVENIWSSVRALNPNQPPSFPVSCTGQVCEMKQQNKLSMPFGDPTFCCGQPAESVWKEVSDSQNIRASVSRAEIEEDLAIRRVYSLTRARDSKDETALHAIVENDLSTTQASSKYSDVTSTFDSQHSSKKDKTALHAIVENDLSTTQASSKYSDATSTFFSQHSSKKSLSSKKHEERKTKETLEKGKKREVSFTSSGKNEMTWENRALSMGDSGYLDSNKNSIERNGQILKASDVLVKESGTPISSITITRSRTHFIKLSDGVEYSQKCGREMVTVETPKGLRLIQELRPEIQHEPTINAKKSANRLNNIFTSDECFTKPTACTVCTSLKQLHENYVPWIDSRKLIKKCYYSEK